MLQAGRPTLSLQPAPSWQVQAGARMQHQQAAGCCNRHTQLAAAAAGRRCSSMLQDVAAACTIYRTRSRVLQQHMLAAAAECATCSSSGWVSGLHGAAFWLGKQLCALRTGCALLDS
jgi:hypothetical protein